MALGGGVSLMRKVTLYGLPRHLTTPSVRSHFTAIGIVAEQPAPAPHLERRPALRIVLVAVPRVNPAFEHFLDRFDYCLLPSYATFATNLLQAIFNKRKRESSLHL